jgi:HD-GYP domain-containing protein (c-di-GMP phosphodiesterase class II)
MTDIYRNDLIYGVSYALDYVERELIGVTPHHSKRVAYMVACMGRSLALPEDDLLDLAACAALHDNALSEYETDARHRGIVLTSEMIEASLDVHCRIGEDNIRPLPFSNAVAGAILYHHETADGHGPFGKKMDETPLYARLIHMADQVDAQYDLSCMTAQKYEQLKSGITAQAGSIFDAGTVHTFFEAFPSWQTLCLTTEFVEEALPAVLPDRVVAFPPQQLIQVASIFSKIIDYKSSFTCRHSNGIAEKAQKMAAFYGWSEDTQAQLYLAGALHDIGKLMICTSILEKPGQLTQAEYRAIQNHAYGSYLVLHPIRGMEKIGSWAYLHHEKLDGSGYPFGCKAEALSKEARLLACLDIYQALIEARPYKPVMPHSEVMTILSQMADAGKLDAQIVADIGRCFG